jgi:DnaK suppressor protein
MPKSSKAVPARKAAARSTTTPRRPVTAKATKAAKSPAPRRAGTVASPRAAKATKGAKKRSTPAPRAATPARRAAARQASPQPAPRPAAKATKKAVPARTAKRAAPASPKPAAKAAKPVGDAKFFAEQRELLLAEREVHTRQAESLRAEADQLAEEMEPGDIQFDEESGEGATMNVERERDLALSAQNRAAVEEIDRALAKLDAGTYGLCEQCGQPIPKPRLKALPYAALCVSCKSGGLSRR